MDFHDMPKYGRSPHRSNVAILPLAGHYAACISNTNCMLLAKVCKGKPAIRGDSLTAVSIVTDGPAAGLAIRGEVEQQRREEFRAKAGSASPRAWTPRVVSVVMHPSVTILFRPTKGQICSCPTLRPQRSVLMYTMIAASSDGMPLFDPPINLDHDGLSSLAGHHVFPEIARIKNSHTFAAGTSLVSGNMK
ncbi:hypothetical protein L210DRAFT_3631682 [Boletus edulis BED1]|uniref:Uncharacterized protein n=1 Tax=Boletus edulis BED1 TaxID=1328754 RepID=A0AAD4BRD6_BOLED|nr:hypothetical protein L210DRAFT_3631682 [Boletus edulis BED1]